MIGALIFFLAVFAVWCWVSARFACAMRDADQRRDGEQ